MIAGESVTFQLTEVRLGLAAAVISLSLLPRFTDRAAADLFLTARKFDAAEAASGRPDHPRRPGRRAPGRRRPVLGDLVKGYPQGLRESKKLLNHDLVARIDALGEQVAAQSAELFGSDEAREAMTAFLSKK